MSNRRKLKGRASRQAKAASVRPPYRGAGVVAAVLAGGDGPVRPLADDLQAPGRKPWNKGLALTRNPTLGTVRRWIAAGVAEGLIEAGGTERTGKPGRPATLYRLTEKGRQRQAEESAIPPKIRMEQQRRWHNARARRLQQRKAAAERQMKRAVTDLRDAQRHLAQLEARRDAEVEKLAEMLYDATTALDRADYDPSSLLPEEIDALTEHGCVASDGGRLYLTEEWATLYAEARGGTAERVPSPAAG